MKKIVLIVSLLMSFTSLAFSQSEDELVKSSIKSGTFEISIDTIYPQSGMPIHDSTYSVLFKDGKVTTVLPFFGTSDTAAFSQEDSSIVLKDCPVKYAPKKKKDSYVISFDAKSGSNSWSIEILVWDNGRCDLTCQCPSKSLMRYSGELRSVSE